MSHRISPSLPVRALAGALLIASVVSVNAADATTKDIVLDRVAAPMVNRVAASGNRQDAMAVSVLLESPDGSLMPRSTDRVFNTGDRFRVKILASRGGRVALYNTNPHGVLGTEPVWRGEVKVGQETISPRLRLDGLSGVDHLHIVLEPEAPPTGLMAWLTNWLVTPSGARKEASGEAAAKDIRLDVQNTESTTYLVSTSGQGLVTTMRIVHR